METDFATQLRELGYRIEDIVETFARSGGPGGQNVNKVSTQVTLKHVPTGLQVIATDHSSQLMNRRVARERMIAAIVGQRSAVRKEKVHEREKKKRQTRPKPRALKEKILKSKKKRAEVKKTRGRVRG